MKVCKYCLKEKPDKDFEVCRVVNGKSYCRLTCQKCKRITTNQRRNRLRKWLTDFKKSLVCARCGSADFRALEFDHTSQGKKDFTVADMIHSGQSKERIWREIDKYMVLCSNYHQIEHDEKHYGWSDFQSGGRGLFTSRLIRRI